jgi:thioredoxin-related protein
MNRIIYFIVVYFLTTETASAQAKQTALYNSELDAMEQIDQALIRASAEGKHLLIQVGGDWCPWCIKLHRFMEEQHQVDSLINADYILIRVNYSKENKNPQAMARLNYPQRFGFPVLVILDGKGQRLHTQNSAYLEEGDSYSETKLVEFLKGWNASAVDPNKYLSK